MYPHCTRREAPLRIGSAQPSWMQLLPRYAPRFEKLISNQERLPEYKALNRHKGFDRRLNAYAIRQYV